MDIIVTIGVIVGFITLLATLFIGIFWPKIQSNMNNRLKIVGNYHKFENTFLKKSIEDYRDLIQTDKLKKNILKLDYQSYYDIYYYFSKNTVIDYISDFRCIYSVWTYEIENIGKNEINGLIIDFPSKGYFESDTDDELIKPFKNQIKLDSIRSGKKINITIWSEKSVLPDQDPITIKYSVKDIRITNPSGQFKIVYPAKVTGILSWLGAQKYWFEAIKAVLIYMLVVGLIFSIVYKIKNK